MNKFKTGDLCMIKTSHYESYMFSVDGKLQIKFTDTDKFLAVYLEPRDGYTSVHTILLEGMFRGKYYILDQYIHDVLHDESG
jgi:hypothetical protein